MKKIKKVLHISISLCLSILLFGVSTTASAATLILSPASGTIAPGQTITVDVLLDTKGAAIDGVDVYSLRYNTSVLEVQDVNSSTSGVQIQPGSLVSITLTNMVSGGLIKFSQVSSGGTTYTGSGKLATITFKGVASGTSPVTFDFTAGSTSDSNVAGAGEDKLTSVGNGSYTVSAATTPPTPTPVPPPVTPPTPTPTPNPTPTPIPQPTPTPTPTPASSSKFSIGNYIKTSSSVNVRSSASASGTLLGSQSSDTTGRITGGPVSSGGFNWWQVNYNSGPDGWSVENYLGIYTGNTAIPAPTPKPTPTPPSYDTVAPEISVVASSYITENSATMTWTTNEPSDSQVEFGLSTAYGSATNITPTLVKSHSKTLTGLAANTTFHFRVRSSDSLGNIASSADHTFTTLSVPSTQPSSIPPAPTPTPAYIPTAPPSSTSAPKVTEVTYSGLTPYSATITWKTTEPSDSQVQFGTTDSYGTYSDLNQSLVTSHTVTISGLTEGTLYHFRVRSRKDEFGNLGFSNDSMFTTVKLSEQNFVQRILTWFVSFF